MIIKTNDGRKYKSDTVLCFEGYYKLFYPEIWNYAKKEWENLGVVIKIIKDFEIDEVIE